MCCVYAHLYQPFSVGGIGQTKLLGPIGVQIFPAPNADRPQEPCCFEYVFWLFDVQFVFKESAKGPFFWAAVAMFQLVRQAVYLARKEFDLRRRNFVFFFDPLVFEFEKPLLFVIQCHVVPSRWRCVGHEGHGSFDRAHEALFYTRTFETHHNHTMTQHPAIVAGVAACVVAFLGLTRCTVYFSLHPAFCTLTVPPPFGGLAGGQPVKTIVTSFYAHSAFTAKQQAAWASVNPGWAVVGYNDTEAAAYLKQHYPPWVAALYAKAGWGPIRGDIFRVFYLAKHGGAWVDADVQLETPIDTWATGVTLWSPASRHRWLLNPTVMVARRGDPTLLAACDLYHDLSRTVFLGRAYWALSVVHVLSALQRAGHPVDATAFEICPTKDIYQCFILGPADQILFHNRVRAWDKDTHAVRSL